MNGIRFLLLPAMAGLALWQMTPGMCRAQSAAALPEGVRAVWDLGKASRESTPTRERVCLNGLWRWQPIVETEEAKHATPPAARWGHMKVPAPWPAAANWQFDNAQEVYPHPDWASLNLQETRFAWYQREITVPATWKGRGIFLQADWVQSSANVYLDGKPAGNVPYPGGRVEITALCRPGQKQLLSLWLAALPLSKEMTSYSHFDVSITTKAVVTRRGLCGDVFLESTPAKARLVDVRLDPSVRKWELGVDAGVADLVADQEYRLKGELLDGDKVVHTFQSPVLKAADAAGGRFVFATPWKPGKLWDTNTPGNVYRLRLTLVDGAGQVADTLYPVRFGFREFWVDGRDFRLNGTRFHASVCPYAGAQMSAYTASYAGARESFLRLKAAGFNLVYSHHYDCLPGANLSYDEVLRAADDTGMLFSYALPGHSGYQLREGNKALFNKPAYTPHVAYYTGRAANHPAVVLYAVNHNFYGYSDLLNPEMIHTFPDFMRDKTDPTQRGDGNALPGRQCEEVIRQFDRSRVIYHHGGSLGAVISPNCYLDFVPIQEVSDWFSTWATQGNKPLFLAEYGTPIDVDFSLFRGYNMDHHGVVKTMENGSRSSTHFYGKWIASQYHLPGWGAQFRGDVAYQLTEVEKGNLRWEAAQWRKQAVWRHFEVPVGYNTRDMDSPNIREVQARYVSENWPAFRTLGVSAVCTWNYGELFQLKPEEGRAQKALLRKEGSEEIPILPITANWESLQQPGYSPDWQSARANRPYSNAREDWTPMPALGPAWLRVTRPALAFLAGKPAHVTGKDHNFYPGETVEKQIIVVNDSRALLTADCEWRAALPTPTGERIPVKVETGEQARVPLKLALPADLKPGEYALTLTARFDAGEVQEDRLLLNVLARPAKPAPVAQVLLFDPAGMTKKVLGRLGVAYTEVQADARPARDAVLILGKNALTVDGPAPDLSAVRDGLRVIVFEQSAVALQERLGFRRQEYGLRNLFPRLPGHPLLAGLSAGTWWNWRGNSGAGMSELKKLDWSKYWKSTSEVATEWCGLAVKRPWRGTTYGAVSSIFIETPSRGDFRPVLEGGFSLQYAPLLEYREGKGMVLFCQLDVSNRDEADPAAETLVHNMVEYTGKWQPAPRRKARYAGDPAGLAHLEKTGIAAAAYEGGPLAADEVLIAGPDAAKALAPHAAAVGAFLKAGGHLLALGLSGEEASAFLPFKVSTKTEEHLAAYFPAPAPDSLLAGANPAGIHTREPRPLPLLVPSAEVEVLGNGVLAQARNANVVFCQMFPWAFDWQELYNLKTTYRHSSVLLSRLLANLGVQGTTPLLARFGTPAPKEAGEPVWPQTLTEPRALKGLPEGRWREGLYLDAPTEGDDPYRWYCW